MDINPNTVEQMAREYGRALENANIPTNNSTAYEQLIILEEEQLELLNCLNSRGSSRMGRTVNYLRNVIYRSLVIISRLNGDNSYIPSVRNACCPNQQNIFNRLINLQLDIFILLDKLTAPYADRAELLMLENRKMATLATLV